MFGNRTMMSLALPPYEVDWSEEITSPDVKIDAEATRAANEAGMDVVLFRSSESWKPDPTTGSATVDEAAMEEIGKINAEIIRLTNMRNPHLSQAAEYNRRIRALQDRRREISGGPPADPHATYSGLAPLKIEGQSYDENCIHGGKVDCEKCAEMEREFMQGERE